MAVRRKRRAVRRQAAEAQLSAFGAARVAGRAVCIRPHAMRAADQSVPGITAKAELLRSAFGAAWATHDLWVERHICPPQDAVRDQLKALLAAFRAWSASFERVLLNAISAEGDDMTEQKQDGGGAWPEIDLAADPEIAALLARMPRPPAELVALGAELGRVAASFAPFCASPVMRETAAAIAKMSAGFPRGMAGVFPRGLFGPMGTRRNAGPDGAA
jgi:hypothetical protein